MSKHQLKAENRNPKTNLTELRKTSLPGNLFGPQRDSQALALDYRTFEKLYQEVGESGVVYLQLEKEEVPAMIEEVQLNPVTDVPIHVSFKVVNLLEVIEASIPVELIGEFDLPEAVLVNVRDEIEVRALPTDLPEKFVINIEGLTEIGQSITLADLEYDKSKVELIVGEEGEEAPIVLVQEVAEEPEEPEEVETEIIGEGEEGEEEEKEAKPEKEEETPAQDSEE